MLLLGGLSVALMVVFLTDGARIGSTPFRDVRDLWDVGQSMPHPQSGTLARVNVWNHGLVRATLAKREEYCQYSLVDAMSMHMRMICLFSSSPESHKAFTGDPRSTPSFPGANTCTTLSFLRKHGAQLRRRDGASLFSIHRICTPGGFLRLATLDEHITRGILLPFSSLGIDEYAQLLGMRGIERGEVAIRWGCGVPMHASSTLDATRPKGSSIWPFNRK